MLLLKSRLLVFGVVLSLATAGAWHYRSVIARNAAMATRIVQLTAENSEMAAALENERKAAAVAVAQRREAQRRLDELRAGRSVDDTPEFIEWSAQRIPPTEKARICAALPEALGCAR